MNIQEQNGEINDNHEIWIEDKWVELHPNATGELVVIIPKEKEDIYIVDWHQWTGTEWKKTRRSLWEYARANYLEFIDL